MPVVMNLAMLAQSIAALAAFRDGDHGIGWAWVAVLVAESAYRWSHLNFA